jgi:hypothetical protein
MWTTGLCSHETGLKKYGGRVVHVTIDRGSGWPLLLAGVLLLMLAFLLVAGSLAAASRRVDRILSEVDRPADSED